MSGGYVLCEYSKIKEYFPEFKDTMDALEASLRSKAEADWAPLRYGGIYPQSNQFGKTTILPGLFVGMGSVQLVSWNQWLTATGHQTIMQGRGTGATIPEDYMVGLAGLAFLDTIRVSEIKMQISDKKLPRMNIEEAMAYEKPAIIFENGYVLDEETGFDLYGYVLSRGPQRIKLIGVQLNRVPNKLQVSNTGAAIA